MMSGYDWGGGKDSRCDDEEEKMIHRMFQARRMNRVSP